MKRHPEGGHSGAMRERRYSIRVRGHPSAAELSGFDRMQTAVEPVETVLHGPVRDQANLHALLRRVQSLGFELVEVRRLPIAHEGDSDSPR
jgi:hypothetical protein